MLPSIIENFSDWYNEIVFKAELCDHAPVKGCIVVLPYAYSMWELMKNELDKEIKCMGVSNMAFPLFIPFKMIAQEKEHVDGFSPEIAVVNQVGGKDLEEPFVVRPTSEVIVHHYFKKWIRSWRDLPLKVNQWCSVVRWEKRPRPFIRTTEFWWQEGHTAHATFENAFDQVRCAIDVYEKFCKDFLCIPVLKARKPRYERFAGADDTWTIEGMMGDGKALQMGTSHLLSQSFCKTLDISFQDQNEERVHPFLTSWGVTTRLIGSVVMVHGDAKGLVIPPRVAPFQFVFVPIFNSANQAEVLSYVALIRDKVLSMGFRVHVDDRSLTPGARYNYWEMKGVPFRVEAGLRDRDSETFVIFNRLLMTKQTYHLKNLTKDFLNILIYEFCEALYNKALDKFNSKYFDFKSASLSSFANTLEKSNGFYRVVWCGEGEEEFKKYGASVRCELGEVPAGTCCLEGEGHVCTGNCLMEVVLSRAY